MFFSNINISYNLEQIPCICVQRVVNLYYILGKITKGAKLKLLSRQEEMLLLAVWRLQHDAYGVKIRELLKVLTGKEWAFGAIFTMLDRLVQKELLRSYLTDPTPERGGRSKRIYQLTKDGKIALFEIKKIERAMWEGIDELGFESK